MHLKSTWIRLTPIGLILLALQMSACAHSPRHSDSDSNTAPATVAETKGFDAELTRYAYPFPVKFYEFESQRQKLKMAYMDVTPEPSNGHTVLLLHGKNFSGAYWAPTMRSLAKAGFRVIVPDQIGFGKSSKPAAYQFTFQTLATNTKGLLEQLGISSFTVVGHSMGGMLATRTALMFPDAVERLVLVNPIGLEDWKTRVSYRSVDDVYQQELKATPESIRAYMQTSYFDGKWKPEYDSLVEILAGWTQNPDYPVVAWDAALTADMIFTQPVIYEFNRVRAPTLLIIGQRDRTAIGRAWATPKVASQMGNYPVLGRRAARLIPGAKLVEIQNSGHLPQVEAFPAYEKALLDFLANKNRKSKK